MLAWCGGRMGFGALLSMSCLMKSNHCDAMRQMKKIPDSSLTVSEPNPSWFGNPANEPSNPAWTNKNWLKSRFHFSFAEYHNPRNSNYGVLRVLNDDLVQPNRGALHLQRAPASQHGDLHLHCRREPHAQGFYRNKRNHRARRHPVHGAVPCSAQLYVCFHMITRPAVM